MIVIHFLLIIFNNWFADVEVMSILHDINNDYLKMRINYFLTLFQQAEK